MTKQEEIREWIEYVQVKEAATGAMDRCPHIIRKLAGDETYDICEINTKFCLLESGECDTWNEVKEITNES